MFPSASNNNQISLNEKKEKKIPGLSMTESVTSYTASLGESTLVFSSVQTEAPEVTQYSSHAGLIIGILLTIISLLIVAILYVVFQVSTALLNFLS